MPNRRGARRVFILCLIGITGCSTYPISKPLRERARATKEIGFDRIRENPDAYKGRVVIWGGKIIQTVNETNATSFYVLQTPLDRMEMPLPERFSRGRFIARSSGFLDPEIYRPGAWITMAGVLVGSETRPLGQTVYTYPLVALQEVYFWRPMPAVYAAPYPVWGWGWYGPYWPYYDGNYPPYYFPGHYYHPPFHPHRDLDQNFDRPQPERREGPHGGR
jgi:outer membrane lipoprotein